MTARAERPTDDEDPRCVWGYRRHTIARTTGTLVILVDGWEQGLSSPGDGDGRWALICDGHGGILTGQTQADLIPEMAHPEAWCPYCQDAKLEEIEGVTPTG